MNKTAKNLFALADFIEKHAPPEQIYMGWFVKEGKELNLSVKPSSIPKNECGTAFCALGWEAVRVPKVAAHFDCWEAFSKKQFPDLVGRQELRCFGAFRDSEKSTVLERLRAAAEEVAAGAGS